MSTKTQARAALSQSDEALTKAHAAGGDLAGTLQAGFAVISGGGQVAISSGVTVTANSRFFVSRRAQGGVVTNTVEYEAPLSLRVVGGPGVGGFTLQASVAAGTPNAADLSVLDWLIVG